MSQTIGKYRWTIVALLFFATTVNYIDRQVIGLLKPTLETAFSWTETDYANIVMAFSATYAIGWLIFGRVIDSIGVRMGYTIAIVVWSIAAMLHAMAGSTMGFIAMRALLGLGEGGNFPAAIKAVAEWFPKRERALATGFFNAGTSLGPVLTPLLVPWLLGVYGWQAAFVVSGAIGFVCLFFWLRFYTSPGLQKRLTKEEYEYIHSDAPEQVMGNEKPVGWWRLLGVQQTWAFIFGKMLTDPVWWFFLFWLPSYFASTFQIDLKKPSLELVIVYTVTALGGIGGGWLSGYFIKKGWPIFRARKTAMLLFALCVTPVILAKYAMNVWQAVGLISLAMAAHQAWSANIFTTASDMFPKRAVSTVVGIGGMAGSVGGILFPFVVGRLLDFYKAAGNITAGYNLLFVVCGCAYLLAWGVMHLFAPRMEQVRL